MARESQDGLLVYLGISAAVHSHRGCLPFRGGKRPNRNLGRYGQLGMKDSQFPANQEIQGPVLHAFTMDRKFYEDCTYWKSVLGFDSGTAYVQHSRSWQVGSDPRHGTFDFAGALPGADRSDLGGQRPEQTEPLFRVRICRCQWLDCTEPQY